MKFAWLLFSLLILQDQVPLKPKDDFEIKLNFEFKERTVNNANKVDFEHKDERKGGSGPLPYLFLNVHVLKEVPEEVRVRVVENGRRIALNKKFDIKTLLKLDLGFTDDIKDRVSPYQYTIIFLNNDKEPLSKVEVFFNEDGTYLVNGQVRGKL